MQKRPMLWLSFSALLFITTTVWSWTWQGGSDAAIVIGKGADPTERFAAEELQRYVERMTSVRWTIQDETPPYGDRHIVVGRTLESVGYASRFDTSLIKSGRDSFLIKANDEMVVLVGGSSRGTLYAVYEFLYQQGCRWFYPGRLGEVIPQREDLYFPSGENFFEPAFIQRSIDLSPVGDLSLEEVIDWAVKNRLNWLFSCRDTFVQRNLPPQKQDVWQKRGGQLQWEWICHNFNHMLPNDKYFDEHPEYYSLYKGQRLAMSERGMGGGNLCTTNPEVIAHCAAFIIDWFDKHPDGQVVPLWPADGVVKWCECESCMTLGGVNFKSGEEGCMTRRMVTFANAVARIVAKKYPDRYILCPAYSNYIRPVNVPLENNILLQYCLHGCYAHAVGQCKPNNEYYQQIQAWASRAAGHMGVWEYFLLGEHVNEPRNVTAALLPVLYRARDNVRFLHDMGVTFYFTQSSPKYWRHNPAVFYLLSRLLWNPELDFEADLKDFCQGFYGDAGGDMLRFYVMIEEQVAKGQWHPQTYSAVVSPSAQVFDETLLDVLDKCLQEAQSRNLTVIQRQRLNLAEEMFAFTQSSIQTQRLTGLDAESPWRLQRGENVYVLNADGQELLSEDEGMLVQNALDMGRYDRQFQRLLFRARKREEPMELLKNDVLEVRILPGIGGRLIRLVDVSSQWNFLCEPMNETTLEQIGETYFNYGGYEEYIGKAFAGPGWEKPYRYARYQTDREEVMVLRLADEPWRLAREVHVPKGKTPIVALRSCLYNDSAMTQTTSLRGHPMFSLGGKAEALKVYLRQADGSYKISTVDAENGNLTIQPDGVWALVNEAENRGLVSFFDPEQAYGYICKTGEDRVNMELMGHETEMTAGDSLTLSQVWAVITEVNTELEQWLASEPQEMLARYLPPIQQHSVSGLVLQPADHGQTPVVRYPGWCISGKTATVEMWLRGKVPNDAGQEQFLFSVGDNNPFWIAGVLSNTKLTFLSKCGTKPYILPGQHYAHVSVQTQILDGQWHYVAWVWDNQGDESGRIALYVDGNVLEERFNMRLGEEFGQAWLTLGSSQVGRHQFFRGEIGSVRISNTALSSLQIAESFTQSNDRMVFDITESALLTTDFKTSIEGCASTVLGVCD